MPQQLALFTPGVNRFDVRKEGTKMKDYRSHLEPGVQDSFEEAVKALREKVGEASATIAETHIKEAIVDYKMAAYMYGYFTAMAETLVEYRIIFYTAASNMIHFKYYNYKEEAYIYD